MTAWNTVSAPLALLAMKNPLYHLSCTLKFSFIKELFLFVSHPPFELLIFVSRPPHVIFFFFFLLTDWMFFRTQRNSGARYFAYCQNSQPTPWTKRSSGVVGRTSRSCFFTLVLKCASFFTLPINALSLLYIFEQCFVKEEFWWRAVSGADTLRSTLNERRDKVFVLRVTEPC